MALISWPEDVTILEEASCIICYQLKPILQLTPCLNTANPYQPPEFLCTAHIWKTQQLILGLADHHALQRQTEPMQKLILQHRLQERQQAQAQQQGQNRPPQQSTPHPAESDAFLVR